MKATLIAIGLAAASLGVPGVFWRRQVDNRGHRASTARCSRTATGRSVRGQRRGRLEDPRGPKNATLGKRCDLGRVRAS